MRNILNIYKKDLRDIFTNASLFIVIFTLCILPSLYAWFNIKASWDPYGNTSNIQVAIINNDIGADALNKKVNVGGMLINKLKSNKSLGWNFVDKKTALDGVNNGTYYASIEIPKNFSKDLTSLVTSDIKKGEIIYTVNEKLNAVAPKITDKGASSIQLQVNETVVKTVSEIIFEVFNEIGLELEEQLPKLNKIENSLIEIQSKFNTINKTLDLAEETSEKVNDVLIDVKKDIPQIKETIIDAKGLSKDVSDFLSSTQDSLKNIAPILKNDLSIISDISSSISNILSSIIESVKNSSNINVDLINSLSSKLDNLKNIAYSLEDFLIKINNLTPNQYLNDSISKIHSLNEKLDSVISLVDTLREEIKNGQTPSIDLLNKINKLIGDISNTSANLLNNFESEIAQPIDNIFTKGIATTNNIIGVLQNAEEKLPAAKDLLDTTLEFSGLTKESLDFIKKKMPQARKLLDELTSAIHKVNNSEDVDKLLDLLKSDVISRSSFLEEPVEVTTNKLYPAANYGASMTPFYTVLSLWVGLMLLVSLLSSNVHGEYKDYEVYFGRGLTFLSIALVQSLIVVLGNLYLLKVEIMNPTLFIAISLFTSVVFTFIVYSLVSIFGNAGKAIGIVFMVIQVAGSGGTFPIQVTPVFFQNVNPWLPFTYAINALRETAFGIYMPNLQKDLIALTLFLVLFICISLFLKRPLNKLVSAFTNQLNESDLSGH